ncbi:MAG: hypothetical protein SVY15_06435 [Halobacteriota archaeon]|nr:hypothetical protein [Halobacteriota archaeon]
MAEPNKNDKKEFDMAESFRKGVFFILMILLLIASIHFYIMMMDAFSTLFEYRYNSLIKAVFAACVIAVTTFLLRNNIVKKS